MTTVQELEKRFLEALAGSPSSFQAAHQIIDELKATGASSQLLALLEVSLDWRENQRYEWGIRRLLTEVLQQEVIDPLIHARSFVVASILYVRQQTEETHSLMLVVESLATEFFAKLDRPQVRTWQVGYLHNMAVTYWRTGRLDEAEMLLSEVVLQSQEYMAFQCWMPKVFILLSLIATDELDFDKAHWYLEKADKEDQGCDLAWRLLAKGRLIQEQIATTEQRAEQLEEAASYFHAAYEKAKENKDYFLMGDTLFALAFLHADTGNLEAFWYTYEMCRYLKEHFGVQIIASIHDLAAEMPPLPMKEGEENAKDLYAANRCAHYQYCNI